MVVLDSDILVDIMRNSPDAVKFFDKLENRGERLNTTVINAFELFEGTLLFPNKEKINESTKKVEKLLQSLGSYHFTGPTSLKAAEISSELKRKGTILDFQDICIASISIVNNEKLITRNIKHFERIKGLVIEKW